MPAQGRLGDRAFAAADAHGCPACPHIVTGPAVTGSPNVRVNELPALRVGDSGIHMACCGENTWNAQKGSCSVLINGRPAHRLSDMTRHCGGTGMLIEGSPNVIVGGGSCGGGSAPPPPPPQPAPAPPPAPTEKGKLQVKVVDDQGKPVLNEPYEVTLPDGSKRTGVTDAQGMISLDGVPKGTCQVKLPKRDRGDVKPK
jgi:uncharacterized Zn-binding protein involved in type VI secretion